MMRSNLTILQPVQRTLGLLGFLGFLNGCDLAGEAEVKPVLKRGPAMTSLETATDVDRITALLPPDNSYANRTTSIAIKVSGTCISGSAAVKVTVANTETKIILACDEQSGTFGTTLDLSSLPDGNVQIEFSFLKAVNSTNPMYVLERRMFKDTESLPAFQVPASLSESSSGLIDIAEVEGAASYKTTFTPAGGGTAIGPIETFVNSVPVTGLTIGTTYTVAVTTFDAAGNDTQASNTGTFIKTGPPNPSGLSATAVSGSQINLAWTSGGGASAGFVVAYQSGASAPASCAAGTILPASGKITGTTYSVTGLSATTQYSFRVCAVNNDTTPAASSGLTASTTTLQAPPPNPSGQSATAFSTTRIDLAWTSGGGSTADYRISYQIGATAPATCDAGTKISESLITGTSHSVTGLTAGTQYSFRICAINGNPTPDTSSGVTATATTFQAPPPNPTGPTATGVSNARIDLAWTSGGGSTADYRIAFDASATPPADCSAGTPIPESSINGTSHSVTGLIGGTQYSFRICAINGNATPDVSGGVTVSGWTIPSNPTSPTATTQSTTQINLSWTAGSGATADYRISYQTGATAPATCAAGTTISESLITGTSHSVTGLTAGTQYSFRICAINANTTPDASSGVTATATTFQAAPPNPTGATATPVTSTRVDLAWTSGGGSTVDYRITYLSGTTPPVNCSSGTTILESSITGTSHSVTGLSADTDYSFRICAINGNATPDVSSGVTVSAKPNSDPPDPTSPSATVDSSSQITLSWTSGDGTTTDFRISYQIGATAPATCDAGTKISESSISGVSHAVSGLSASTEYSFRICAINGNTPAAVSGGVTVSATTSAGGSGGTEYNYLTVVDLFSDDFIFAWGLATDMGNYNATYNLINPDSTRDVKGAALTLDGNNAPWVFMTESSATNAMGTMVKVGFDGQGVPRIDLSPITDLVNNLNGFTGDASITWMKASANPTFDRILNVFGWGDNPSGSTRNVRASNMYEASSGGVWTEQPSQIGFESTSAATGPLGFASAVGKNYDTHLVTVMPTSSGTSSITYDVFRYSSSGSWTSPPRAFTATKEDGGPCYSTILPNIAFDPMDGDWRPHVVYYCRATGSNTVVHAWDNGSSWIKETVHDFGSAEMNLPATVRDSRLGFAIHSSVPHVIYWGTDGSLQYKQGTWNSGSGKWTWPSSAQALTGAMPLRDTLGVVTSVTGSDPIWTLTFDHKPGGDTNSNDDYHNLITGLKIGLKNNPPTGTAWNEADRWAVQKISNHRFSVNVTVDPTVNIPDYSVQSYVYHTPQIVFNSAGEIRIYYVRDDLTDMSQLGWAKVVRATPDPNNSGSFIVQDVLAVGQSAHNVFLGNGIGVTDVGGNSRR